MALTVCSRGDVSENSLTAAVGHLRAAEGRAATRSTMQMLRLVAQQLDEAATLDAAHAFLVRNTPGLVAVAIVGEKFVY